MREVVSLPQAIRGVGWGVGEMSFLETVFNFSGTLLGEHGVRRVSSR